MTVMVAGSGLTQLSPERRFWSGAARRPIPGSIWTTDGADPEEVASNAASSRAGSAVLSVLTLITSRIDAALKDISEKGVVEYVWEFDDGSAASCVFDDEGNVDIWIEDSEGNLVVRDDASADGRLEARSSVLFQKKVLGGRLAS